MNSWRDKISEHIDDSSVPFAKEVCVKLTPHAVNLINTLAEHQGITRSEYIRNAIAQQMIADGIRTPPPMRPYDGKKLRRDPVTSWKNTVTEADIT